MKDSKPDSKVKSRVEATEIYYFSSAQVSAAAEQDKLKKKAKEDAAKKSKLDTL